MPILRALLAVALLAAARAHAGYVVDMTTGEGRASRLQIEGKRWRIDTSAAKGAEGRHGPRAEILIVDGESQTFTFANPDERTYTSVNQAQIEAFVRQAQARMKESLARFPPEKRKQAEEAMKAQLQAMEEGPKLPAVRYEKTGRTGTAAGHRCVFYEESTEGDPERAEVCIASFEDVGVRKEDFRALGEWKGFPGTKRRPDASSVWARSPGVPLIRERRGADGKMHEDLRVLSVKRASIPADVFRVPAGFTEKKAAGP